MRNTSPTAKTSKLIIPANQSGPVQPLPSAQKFGDSTVGVGWLLLVIGFVVGLIPSWGFLLWIIGIPLLIAAFCLSIAAMLRGRAFAGTFLMLSTLILGPVIYLVLPLISWAAMAQSAEGSGKDSGKDTSEEVSPENGWIMQEPKEEAKEGPRRIFARGGITGGE